MSSPALRCAASLRTFALIAAILAPALLQGCASLVKTDDYYFMGQAGSPAPIVPGVAVTGLG